MSTVTACPICANAAEIRPTSADVISWKCVRCGQFELSGTGESSLRSKPISSSGAVSGWIRQQNLQGITPCLTSDDVPSLRERVAPSFKVRAEAYLREAVRAHPKLTDRLQPMGEDLIGASYSADPGETKVIASYLAGEGLLTDQTSGDGWHVSARGRIAADELAAQRKNSSQAFVAMWFSTEMLAVYESAIRPAIEAAGYSPMMIGSKEHSNKIDDEIISEIRRSAFVVADFTGHRGGVYFEAGFAMGLGLPLVWACRKDDLSGLHFDIRQYNCIDWMTEADFATRLQKRITAMFGQGPVPTE